MKKFSFRLQKLLDLSRRREEEARAALARKLQDLKAAEGDLSSARERVTETLAELGRSLGRGRVDPREIGLLEGWLGRAERAQRSLEERLAHEERAYEKARAVMAERRRELLSFERGRERALEDWREEAGREEAAVMEEVAAGRHQAGRSES